MNSSGIDGHGHKTILYSFVFTNNQTEGTSVQWKQLEP